MKSPHFLKAGNPYKIRENLGGVIDSNAIDAITGETNKNVEQLLGLGSIHFTFAKKLTKKDWRQRISRLYYGAYNTARSVRLFHNGVYSTDASDHKKIDDLPDDFPNHNTYKNKLSVLRDDRNSSDYDHTIGEEDLVLDAAEATALVEAFISDAKSYLVDNGLTFEPEE